MKSKRAKEFIGDTYLVGHPAFPIRIDIKNDLVKAVELAEQDAEERIEALKARAAEAYCEQCGWYEADGNCSINEDKCPKGCEYANQFIQKLNEQ